MKFIDLSKEDRVDILDRVSTELDIRQREVIEKDWWVTILHLSPPLISKS